MNRSIKSYGRAIFGDRISQLKWVLWPLL